MSTAYTPNPEALIVGKHKFACEKITNQFMEKDIRFEFINDGPTFTIEASMTGIKISGDIELSTMKELQQFAELITEAWKARSSLKLKLSTSVSGH